MGSDAGAVAKDVFEGEVSSKLKMSSNVRTDVPGLYSVRFNISDAAANSAEEVVRLVEVVDTTGPVIKLIGEAVVVTAYGLEYDDPGATAHDLVEGDVSERIIV